MSKKRRQYSAEFKLETILEGMRSEKPIAQLCRERGIRDTLYYKWRDTFKERAAAIFTRQDQQDSLVNEQEARIADLERMVGKLAMENEILKKARHWLDGQSRRNGR